MANAPSHVLRPKLWMSSVTTTGTGSMNISMVIAAPASEHLTKPDGLVLSPNSSSNKASTAQSPNPIRSQIFNATLHVGGRVLARTSSSHPHSVGHAERRRRNNPTGTRLGCEPRCVDHYSRRLVRVAGVALARALAL